MERRLLLVFALTFLVIILFQPFSRSIAAARPAPRRRRLQRAAAASRQPTASALRAAPVAVPPQGATKQAAAEAETVIENDLYGSPSPTAAGRSNRGS